MNMKKLDIRMVNPYGNAHIHILVEEIIELLLLEDMLMLLIQLWQ